MKNKDAFGCTTFRKGNYLGRSYDFYCNNVASSVLHTGRIEGVRYESIGMSGSSFNGMVKDKAIDGSIDKATMDTLFSSIVDGINENGVAISTLVVPRGDKGITTGTNPSKPSITARLVSRVVMDKAYSAKHAIKLLSELNLVQNWGTEYELHWMIADKNSTYIVETVDNKLSYLGPEAIEGIEDLYNGQLEADVITNFYISGFKSSFNNNYVEGESSGKYYRLYEVPEPLDGDEERYYYANGDDPSVLIGGLRKSFSIDPNSELYNLIDDDKYYILAEKSNGVWKADGIELRDEPLYHKDGTLVDMPTLSEFVEGTGDSYNTFEMPVTNPTVTPHGCGLERYKAIKDKLAQVNGTLADDEEAMGIINLVQYTNAYKMDNTWYSEFVDHEYDNRSPLVEGAPYTRHEGTDGAFYRVYPIVGATAEDYDRGQVTIYELDEHREGPYSRVGLFNYLGVDYYEDSLSFDFQDAHPEEGKYYAVLMEDSDSVTGYSDVCFGQPVFLGYVFHDYGEMEFQYNSFYSLTSKPSEYVNKVNELRTTYNQILSEGGKDAVRKIGLAWHSNHQCVYDIVNKTMLVYPSENGEHAFRIDVHGVVENEAVEIGGGGSSSSKQPVGGAIYYIDSSDNGATYKFYDEDNKEITGWSTVGDLVNAKYYTVDGVPSKDKFYVFDNSENALATQKRWTYYEGSSYIQEQIFATPSDSKEIGQGRINTQTVMAKDDGKYIADNSNSDGCATIWYVCDEVNTSERGGCSDWFIPSQNELDALRTSSVVPSDWFSSNYIWTSSEKASYDAWMWYYNDSNFDSFAKSSRFCCVCIRAF